MDSPRWTHTAKADHEPDPHYNGNGLPSWWSCHKCGGELRLDGKTVPLTVPPQRRAS